MEIEIHLDINNYRYSVLFIGHCFQCWKLGLLADDLRGLVELSRHSVCTDAGQEACFQCCKLGLQADLWWLVELSRHSVCTDAGQEACFIMLETRVAARSVVAS